MSAGRTVGIWVGSGGGPTGSLMVALAPCACTTPAQTAAPPAAALTALTIVILVKRIVVSIATFTPASSGTRRLWLHTAACQSAPGRIGNHDAACRPPVPDQCFNRVPCYVLPARHFG